MPIFKFLMVAALAVAVSLPSAAAPRIVTSIKPLHALVSAVTGDASQVHLLVPANSSPHIYSMKASDARALADADLVVWTGEGMERFLVGPIASLASSATQLQLAQMPGVATLPLRANPLHQDADDGHLHGSQDIDYHLWLSPQNARVAVRGISEVLAAIDPDSAARYRDNVQRFELALDHEVESIEQRLQPMKDRRYLTLHDSFQYFEHFFGLHSAGVIAVQPDIRPGAATTRRLNTAIAEQQIGCVFSEPQFSRRLVDRLVEGHEVATAELDPLGASLDAGPQMYLELLRANSQAFERCLGASGQ
jgi:zinc transport system substrate-binding protein